MMEKPIVLVGFMGVGKTTVGQIVARRLGCPFIDTDEAIVEEAGQSIPQLFDQYGEAHFRQLEKNIVIRLLKEQVRRVISLGGGAFLQDDIREACLRYGVVFFLDLSWTEWLKRYTHLKHNRPLLQQNDITQIKALYDQRYPIYAQSHIHLKTEHRLPDEVAQEIIERHKFVNL